MEDYRSLALAGCPMYEVSSHGDVRNIKTGRLLKQQVHKGYMQLSLRTNEGSVKHFRVHRLVAMAFIPNPDNLPEVNHKDECTTNNDVSNLEWCSGRYNIEYSKLNKPVCKYDKEGKLLCTYWTIAQAALCGGFNVYNLSAYLNGRRKKLTFKGYVYCYQGETPVLPPKEEPKVVKTATPMTHEEKIALEKQKKHEYYLANKDKYIERKKKWREENPEKYKQQMDNYRERRKWVDNQYKQRPEVIERRKQQAHEYYLAHKEEYKQRQLKQKTRAST